jgi:hypothetical protein
MNRSLKTYRYIMARHKARIKDDGTSNVINIGVQETEGKFMIFGIGLLGFEFRIVWDKGVLIIGGRFPKVLS